MNIPRFLHSSLSPVAAALSREMAVGTFEPAYAPVIDLSSGEPQVDLTMLNQLPPQIALGAIPPVPPSLRQLFFAPNRKSLLEALPIDLQAEMFGKVDEDMDFMVRALGDVLSELRPEGVRDELISRMTGTDFLEQDLSEFQDLTDREIQILSISFLLLNMVEENTAVHIRRLMESQATGHGPSGLFRERFATLKTEGKTEDEIAQALAKVSVEPVLTAHPTEARRSDVRMTLRELYKALVEREKMESRSTPMEKENHLKKIRSLLVRLLETEETYITKPRLEAERESVMYFLRARFPEVLADLDKRLRYEWAYAGFDPERLKDPKSFPRFTLGNWVGGDRDGHPGVTAEFTWETLMMMRQEALDLHRNHLSRLDEELSFSTRLVRERTEGTFLRLEARISQMTSQLGDEGEKVPGETPEKNPWRIYVRLMLARLPRNAEDEQPGLYRSASELQEDLAFLRESLSELGHENFATESVFPVERAVQAFGFHMARLDVRQDSSFHDEAVEEILKATGKNTKKPFLNWSSREKKHFLETQLSTEAPLLNAGAMSPARDSKATDVLNYLRRLAEYRRRFGQEGLGPLIVSMTRDENDLLVMLFLAKEAGLLDWDGEHYVSILPIAPLFETVQALQDSSKVMTAFWKNPTARKTLERSGEIQEIMLGYSDSVKDGGILASQWGLRRAQQRLIEAARKFQIRLEFFHGRGGTISRGAGATHHFLDALAPGTVSHRVRVTVQGETITEQFSNRLTGVYNAELWIAGVLAGSLRSQNDLSREAQECMDFLAKESQRAYRDLLEKDGFLDFHAAVTPDVNALAHFGSRPAKRSNTTRSLENLRAISWVFGWTQARFYLPGLYGVGPALSALQKQNPDMFERFVEEAKGSSFLRYIFADIEANVLSASEDVMALYAKLDEDTSRRDSFMNQILENLRLTREMLEAVLGNDIANRRPRLHHTLARRAPFLDALHRGQIALLRCWRSLKSEGRDTEAENLRLSLLFAVNAIANGERTTG